MVRLSFFDEEATKIMEEDKSIETVDIDDFEYKKRGDFTEQQIRRALISIDPSYLLFKEDRASPYNRFLQLKTNLGTWFVSAIARIEKNEDENLWEIEHLQVHWGLRKIGIGRKFYSLVEEELRNRGVKYIWIESVSHAIPFWTSIGFRKRRTWPSKMPGSTIWGGGRTLQVMSKKIG